MEKQPYPAHPPNRVHLCDRVRETDRRMREVMEGTELAGPQDWDEVSAGEKT